MAARREPARAPGRDAAREDQGLEHRVMDMVRHGYENTAITHKIHQWSRASRWRCRTWPSCRRPWSRVFTGCLTCPGLRCARGSGWHACRCAFHPRREREMCAFASLTHAVLRPQPGLLRPPPGSPGAAEVQSLALLPLRRGAIDSALMSRSLVCWCWPPDPHRFEATMASTTWRASPSWPAPAVAAVLGSQLPRHGTQPARSHACAGRDRLVRALAACLVLTGFIRRLRAASRRTFLMDRPSFASAFSPRCWCTWWRSVLYAHLIPELGTWARRCSPGSVVSVVLGLAAQNTLGNLIAGMSLVLYRPIRATACSRPRPGGLTTAAVEQVSLVTRCCGAT